MSDWNKIFSFGFCRLRSTTYPIIKGVLIIDVANCATLRIWYNNMSSFLFQNTIQLTLLSMHQCLLGMHHCSHVVPQTIVLTTAVNFGHALLHTNPLSLHLSWYWETFIQSSYQIAQFLRSKSRQKGDQFFYQMPDFCENYNPYSSYHTTAVGEGLVDTWFAETCQLTLFTFLKIFYQFEKWEFLPSCLIACSNRQFEHAVLHVGWPLI